MLSFLTHPVLLILYGVVALAFLVIILAKSQKGRDDRNDMIESIEKNKVSIITKRGEEQLIQTPTEGSKYLNK